MFTLDFIYICNELISFHSSLLCKFYRISKFKRTNKSFHRILLIFSGDASLTPGPAFNSQSSCDIGYLQKHFVPTEIENIFKILLPETKPPIVGIIYRPPNNVIKVTFTK